MLEVVLELALISILAAGPGLELPWSCGETYRCTQANGGDESHAGFARYGWDFGMPLGADIVAAHGGTVLMLKMDSQVGGCSSVYADDANYVLIDHHDGTAGLYLHVEGRSSDLAVGDPVAAGDVIARVGQTGWSCGPHLHFQVQELCGSWWCQSLPASFQGVGSLARDQPITKGDCAGIPVAEPATSDSRTWLLGLLAPVGLGLAWGATRRPRPCRRADASPDR